MVDTYIHKMKHELTQKGNNEITFFSELGVKIVVYDGTDGALFLLSLLCCLFHADSAIYTMKG